MFNFFLIPTTNLFTIHRIVSSFLRISQTLDSFILYVLASGVQYHHFLICPKFQFFERLIKKHFFSFY
jgi:hypothetical protein